MGLFRNSRHAHLMVSAAVGALTLGANAAWAQTKPITIAPQTLASALHDFGAQTGRQIMFTPESAASKMSHGVDGATDEEVALAQLLQGTGLSYRREANIFIIVGADQAPQSGSAAGDGADQGTVQALIVTAQKREEDIQDVPIAISAFTQEDLTRSQVAGGPDLMTQVPNMTFTKTNFSSYSIQLRGIGTQAISATTDPAVAVAFNNTPFIRNRFFEQEFYDLQRVEVLRGPQGTLYGRNATAGVVNIISAKPKFTAEAKLSADVSNYNSSRLEGMVNIPLVEDKVALRLAGAWTKREGYATNQLTGQQIDGRDLWSTRLSLRFAPTDRLEANLIWEHFQEDDDRLRSGKQLCKKDVVTEVGGFPVGYFQDLPGSSQSLGFSGVQGTLSQGCQRESLYSPDVYQTPVGLMLPYYVPLGAIGLPVALQDPFVSAVQSHDLRVIESTVDPDYRAKSDIGELQISFDLTDNLTLSSETAYGADWVFSLQDFNRFATAPHAWATSYKVGDPYSTTEAPTTAFERGALDENGVFCDPQVGCADRVVAVDLSTARARQFSQELRLASNFGGPFNFSLGANFLRADSVDKYYVFINSLSLIAASGPPFNLYGDYVPGYTDNSFCLNAGLNPGDPNAVYPVGRCVYIDPNPVSSLNDMGHNYFLSQNPYKLISYAVFGEAYYNITDTLKLTGGLRWTVDKKEAPRIPTWILASQSTGYPVAETIEQEWREPTGRLTIDWKPKLRFTDETLLYGSIAHGYKAGGANPPGFVRVFYALSQTAEASSTQSATRPRVFDAEFLNAYEVGAKNTLAGGRATLNLAAFYYDYTGYQVSEIVDRSAFNRNFDAKVWGLEVEADWRPLENLRLGFKGGYEKTRIADGEQAVDLMDRTAGHDDWVVVRPFPTFASSCILPASLFVGYVDVTADNINNPVLQPVNVGSAGGGGAGGCELAYTLGVDPVTQLPYVPNPVVGNPGANTLNRYPNYPGFDPTTAPNGGEGFYKQLGGNELPNAPHWTATVTGDYTVPLPSDWLMTLHTDVHWQSQSWWRVFNDSTYDKLHPYFTMNLAAIFTNEEAGWNIMAYVKNVTDETAITGAFLNSDDTGLTTNVFLTEPRLYGLRVTKAWSDLSLLGGMTTWRGGPSPLTLELGGQILRQDAFNEPLRPTFINTFPVALDTFDDLEDIDLDHGDGREVKLTWRPNGSAWKVSAGLRYGRANAANRRHAEQESEIVCPYAAPGACASTPQYYYGQINSSDVALTKKEEHTIADFSVGREVGLGGLEHSSVSAALRYAQFTSSRGADIRATPDWYFPNGWYGYYTTHVTRYRAELQADREFKGLGPILSWEASKAFAGDDATGRVAVDWSFAGGVMFGKQKTLITGTERSNYYELSGSDIIDDHFVPPTEPETVTLVNVSRSTSVSVPVLDISLGLSYEVQRIKIGAGYRWERYFDVIDGGQNDHKDADRTIDGPYFKIAVGFGG